MPKSATIACPSLSRIHDGHSAPLDLIAQSVAISEEFPEALTSVVAHARLPAVTDGASKQHRLGLATDTGPSYTALDASAYDPR
jgi:hypothetical protein